MKLILIIGTDIVQGYDDETRAPSYRCKIAIFIS